MAYIFKVTGDHIPHSTVGEFGIQVVCLKNTQHLGLEVNGYGDYLNLQYIKNNINVLCHTYVFGKNIIYYLYKA